MRRAASFFVCTTIALQGCTYITQAQFEEKRNSIDEDGDGTPWIDDCNDRDPDIHPGAVDLPYDAIDSDCDGEDLIDADGDGFPGISEEAYAALGSDVAYPPDLVGQPVDCADDEAIYENAALIYPDPTGAIEVPYDAIDGDCQGDNDFDVDGDGFMPDEVTIEGVVRPTAEVFEEYLAAWDIDRAGIGAWAPPGHPGPVTGDCDDNDATVHPENAVAEVFYDGIDRDCDHQNDFDMDGDCFMPPAAAALYDEYVTRLYGNAPPPFCVDPDLPFGDCLDAPDPSIVAVPSGDSPDPASVHPDTDTVPNVDAPYDAIDSDCAADNDFDGDSDGFMPDEVPYELKDDPTVTELMLDYAAMWGYLDAVDGWADNPEAGLVTPTEGDCDDTRADTWPGAVEVLGDDLDQDCAGDPDRTAWGFGDGAGDYDWTNPTNPEVARLGDTLLVMVGAEGAQIPGVQEEIGVAFPFDLAAARGGAIPNAGIPPYWKATSPNLTMQSLVDVEILPDPPDIDKDGIPDPVVSAAYNTDNTVTGYTHLSVTNLRYNTGDPLLAPLLGTIDFIDDSYTATAINVIHDVDGDPFALACSPTWLHLTFPEGKAETGEDNIEGIDADTCFFSDRPTGTDPATVPFSLCSGGACEDWSASSTPELVNEGPGLGGWAFGDQDGDWIALIDGAGAATVRAVGGGDEAVFTAQTTIHLDVAYSDPNLFVAGVVDGGGGPEIRLAFGPPGDLVEVDLPYDDPSVDGEVPRWVGVYADADRVVVAVTALTGIPQQDSVGWVFFAPPG